MNKQQFAAIFGPIVRVFAIAKPILHLVSFSLAIIFFYFTAQNILKSLALDGVFAFEAMALVFTVAAPSILEYLHFYVPSIFARLLFTLGKWWRNGRTWLMFTLLGSALFGITWFSQYSSRGGADSAVDYRKENTPPPAKDSLIDERQTYRFDSTAIASQYNALISAERLAMEASKDSVASIFDTRVIDLQKKLSNHRIDKARGNTWAQSWIEKRNRQIRDARAEKPKAIAAAVAPHQKKIAAIQSEKANKLILATATLQDAKKYALNDYKEQISEFNAVFDKQRKAGDLIGFWVVFAIVLIDIFIVFYEVGSGREFVGAEWKPSGKVKAWANTVLGIFTDKVDHLYERTDATRSTLKKRNEAKPFQLPTGRTFMRGLATVFLIFAGFQLPEVADGYFAQFSVIPSPWNWPLALAAVCGVLLAYGEKINLRGSEPVAPSGTTIGKTVLPAKTKKTKSKPKKTKTTVEEVSISCLNSDRSSLLFEIDGKKYNSTQMQDKIRKYYERSKTSKRQKTKDKNESIYLQLKAETSQYFVFSEGGNSVSVNLK